MNLRLIPSEFPRHKVRSIGGLLCTLLLVHVQCAANTGTVTPSPSPTPAPPARQTPPWSPIRAETPSGPKISYSAESTIEQVARTPGAIGLVQMPVTAKSVKVIRIDGRAPGQGGYRLR